MKRIIALIDLADVFLFVGLFLLGLGLWWFAPWVSLTTVGAVMVVLAVMIDSGWMGKNGHTRKSG